MRVKPETENHFKFIRFRSVQSCNIANSKENSSVIYDFWICILFLLIPPMFRISCWFCMAACIKVIILAVCVYVSGETVVIHTRPLRKINNYRLDTFSRLETSFPTGVLWLQFSAFIWGLTSCCYTVRLWLLNDVRVLYKFWWYLCFRIVVWGDLGKVHSEIIHIPR
jgi:hypothetical protein